MSKHVTHIAYDYDQGGDTALCGAVVKDRFSMLSVKAATLRLSDPKGTKPFKICVNCTRELNG